jgi:8-oxo-dGTP diphosphatase
VAALAEDLIRAAGAVLWRPGQRDSVEIALVHRPKYDDWSLPKGKLATGEHVLAAAVRELREETGQRVVLGRPLPTQRYVVDGQPKEVRYWSAWPVGERLAAFVPSREVDDLLWLPAAQARDRLTHARDGELVEALTAGPLRTTALILLRHCRAVGRDDWTGDDRERPLNADGEAAADRLGELLEAYAVACVYSSDARRCVDTVRPYAERHGLTIDLEPAWSESGFDADRETGLSRARGLLGSVTPTVLSGHRQVLPVLAAELCRGGDVPPPGGELEVGGFWVLHVAEGKVVALEHHQPAPPAPVSRLAET